MNAVRQLATEHTLPARSGSLQRYRKLIPSGNWEHLAAAATIVLLSTVYFISWRAPSVGLYHDDGVYAVTAKALAEGHGYRLISLPHEIPQTKYPFLFPFVLSLVWRLWPHFPDNVMALKSVPLLCAIAWFVVTYTLLLRMGAKEAPARWIVLIAAASPTVIFLSTNLMSEAMFGALFMGALLAANSAEQSNSSKMACVAGVCAGLAFLTRTIGISLLVGIPAALIFQRCFRNFCCFLLASLPVACTWPLWTLIHRTAADLITSDYTSASYQSWNIIFNYSVHEKLRVLQANILAVVLSPVELLGFPLPLWMAIVASLLLLALILTKRAQLNATYCVIATYLLICICWAWPPDRFIAVILPLILFTIWDSCSLLALRRIAAVLGCIGLCVALYGDLRRVPTTVSEGQFYFSAGTNWWELKNVYSWLSRNAPKGSAVLANLDPTVFLYTGRKSMRNFVEDPIRLFYTRGAPTNDPPGYLEAIIRSASATFLIVTPDEEFGVLPRNVEQFRATHPGVLELVSRPGANPEYQIYRIRSSRLR